MDLLAKLNQQQEQAVLHNRDGPAVVLAGAGSGKTRVLTTRAAYLIKEKNLQPENILLMTFTNKAAQEMSGRVRQSTGYHLPYSGTFHRICALMLRRDGTSIGLDPNYVIYDTQDQEALIKQIYQNQDFDHKRFNRNAVKAVISTAKNKMLSPTEYQKQAESDFEKHVAKVYKLYQYQLKKNQAVDFDDLLLKTVELFNQCPQILHKYQQQFLHVLVDEYQDTNKAQYLLTKLLGQPQNNVYVVGDFSQSIYAWRGADYRNLEYLKKDFGHITSYKLEQNYRSTQTILDAATQVISKNTGHPVLSLWTDQSISEPIIVLETQDNEDEAQAVLNEISLALKDYSYQDVVILYRVNAQSRAFEEACVQQGIPYQLIGSYKFYERKEIKDVLSYLRLLFNPQDKISRDRAIKLGKRRFIQFNTWAQQQAHQKKQTQLTPFQAIENILKRTKYLDKFSDNDPQDLARIENVQELLNVAGKFDNLANFLENIALVQDNHLTDIVQANQHDAVTLMSLHSAKGLEFPVVFMVGMEEGLLPHSRSLYNPDQLEEERRLCYVGITRAQKRLYFSYAKKRWQYGNSSQTIKSRFLNEINPQLLKIKDQTSEHSYSQRRVVLDDKILDLVLNGDMDLDAFLNS
ncbi:UvrD-helicase domain-containing protein [Patescibacteria group bacterium]|nr:UvrD-helicase domain-containing protein [Patescibacteria group bacterium]MBU1967334.1 UvrD-helicase domain-containing protein [Patescibacteria group bacterium]MBU2543185.1 UvrD-helicase domain-containing protein [Patescibacteria group bacterium]